jgi:hypothetical protein
LFSARKFQFVLHACGEGLEAEWAAVSFANELGFRLIDNMTEELYSS